MLIKIDLGLCAFNFNFTHQWWNTLGQRKLKYESGNQHCAIYQFRVTTWPVYCGLNGLGLWYLMPLSNIFQSYRGEVLLVKKSRFSRENYLPASSHWQTLLHNVVLSTPCLSRIRTHNVSCGLKHCLINQMTCKSRS
jgi:hypothetical protein